MSRTRGFALAGAMFVLADVALAASPVPVRRTVPAAVSAPSPGAAAAVSPGKLAVLAFSDVMFMTDKDGKNFWQVRIDNKGTVPTANVVVPAWLYGFMPKSEKPCHAAPIAAIAPGATAYARGPLPLFEGAHLLKIKTQGPMLDVQLPRPYRRDADGRPASALKVEEFTVSDTGQAGTVRFVMTTNQNIYAPIPMGAMILKAFARLRKHVSSDAAFTMPVSQGGQHSMTAAIPTGGRWTVTGTITTGSGAWSRQFDRVAVRLGSQVVSRPVSEIHWKGCARMIDQGVDPFEACCN